MREGATLMRLANFLWCPGRGVEAMPVALDSVGILEGLPVGPELVEAYATLSFLCYSAADRAGARQWAARAYDLAVDLDDTAALARAEYAVGRVELEEDPEPGRERVLRARALAEQSGLEEIVAETYLTLGEIEDRSHVLPRARSRADRALPRRRTRGQRARAWPLDRGHDVSERRPRSARGLDVPRHARPHGARARPRAPRRPGRRAAAGAGARAGRSDGRARADHSGRRRERGSRVASRRHGCSPCVDGRRARPRSSHRIARCRRRATGVATTRRHRRAADGHFRHRPVRARGRRRRRRRGLLLVGARPALRGGTGTGGRRERGSPPSVARHTGLARRPGSGVRRGAPPAATRRSRRAARPSALDALERRRAHGPRARRPPASSPTGFAMRRSPSGCSSRHAPSTTTSRQSSASSTRARAGRRSPSPAVSRCSKTGSAGAKSR